MYKQINKLTSIPEMAPEEEMGRKWVPKKKHEVLKAKYKCLKKLFQIYDASVIGILPEPNPETVDETKTNHRRKRSHRTKTDACAGTTELYNGDNTISEFENTSVGTAIICDFANDRSCISTQIDSKIDKYAETVDSNNEIRGQFQNDNGNFLDQDLKEDYVQNMYPHSHAHPVPFLVMNEKRKLTRFQCFVQRLFGIRRESYNSLTNDHLYAASDTLTRDKRRRRGLRFRRLRRPKKIKSESALRDIKSPIILSYVQSVQRNCLTDTTSRLCPIVGCQMISNGIINYNDHLNLCHFKERKYNCHFCHEGFNKEYDKLLHENEHIGIGRLSTEISDISTARQTSNTQTDPEMNIPEEKLKKIVSFFDKISEQEQKLSEIKKNLSSECNLRSDSGSEDSDKTRTTSCCNIRRPLENKLPSYPVSEASSRIQRFAMPFICHFCGEDFNYRRQLNLHMNLEHRVHDQYSKKYPKFHSCAGIVSPHVDMSEDGKIDYRSDGSHTKSVKRNKCSTLSEESVSRRRSAGSLSCDPSTNIVYYTSAECVAERRVPTRGYHWEPGTRIIRV